MGRKKRLIIPLFIPFGGCAHQCVFCDQEGITGGSQLPHTEEISSTIESYLSTWEKSGEKSGKGAGEREAAFYGGSFTGLPIEVQERYLKTAFGFVQSGRLDSLRVSTRPDCVSGEAIAMLSRYRVSTVELGVQSMDDGVLRLSGRNHTADDTRKAVEMLQGEGFRVGLQFMPGLPGDTVDTILRTTEEVIALRPDFVRVYPTLVLKGTPLYRMYLAGTYRPWPLDEMAEVCGKLLGLLDDAGVPVIRVGLQPTEELVASIAAGPFHPAFRELAERRRTGKRASSNESGKGPF